MPLNSSVLWTCAQMTWHFMISAVGPLYAVSLGRGELLIVSECHSLMLEIARIYWSALNIRGYSVAREMRYFNTIVVSTLAQAKLAHVSRAKSIYIQCETSCDIKECIGNFWNGREMHRNLIKCFRKLNLFVWRWFLVFLWGLEAIWPYYTVGRLTPNEG